MKKFITICLTFLMLCGITITAFADTVYTEGALKYVKGEGTITIVGYYGRESEVYVPNAIAGLPVNTIASGAFVGTHAKTVYLPDTIMEIEEAAFDESVEIVFNYNVQATTEINEPETGVESTTEPAAELAEQPAAESTEESTEQPTAEPASQSTAESTVQPATSSTVTTGDTGGAITQYIYITGMQSGDAVTNGENVLVKQEDGTFRDEDGNTYTVNEEDNVIEDEDGNAVANIAAEAELEAVSDEVNIDEIIEEETPSYTGLIIGIIVAVLAAGGAGYVVYKKEIGAAGKQNHRKNKRQ